MSTQNTKLSLPGTTINLEALGLKLPDPDAPIETIAEEPTIDVNKPIDNNEEEIIDTPAIEDNGLGILTDPDLEVDDTKDQGKPKEKETTKDEVDESIINTDNIDDEGGEEASDLPTLYYNNLVENGLLKNLPEDFEFDGTFEGLQQAQLTHDKATEAAIKDAIWYNMPDDLKPVVEYGLKGGTDINEFIEKLQEFNVPDFDISTDAGQEAVIRYVYKRKGISENIIESSIIALDEKNQLASEAQHALDVMEREKTAYQNNKIAEATRMEQQRIKDEKLFQETAKSAILAKKEWDNNTKRLIYTTMFKKDETGVSDAERKLSQIKNDPNSYAELVNFINHYDVNSNQFKLERYFKISENLEKKVKTNWEKGLNSSTAIKSKSKAKKQKRRVDPTIGPFSV